MVDEIRVRIIPGCPSRVIAETEEDRAAAELTLEDMECGCTVEVEGEKAELLEEAAELEAEVERVKPICSLEPDTPWEESVCGVVAEEAGRQAADEVMDRLREEGLIT